MCSGKQETHTLNDVFAMELGAGVRWDEEEEAKRETSEWEHKFKEDTRLVDLMDKVSELHFPSR